MPARQAPCRWHSTCATAVVSRERPNILIVEKDGPLAGGLVPLLGAAGYEAVAAQSFEEGRAALQHAPDLILTELRLGPYNGLQLILRGRALDPRLRAIVITGHADPVLRREAEALDVLYLEKPITPESLLDEITRAIAAAERGDRV